jgi:hypothetical protein
MEGQAVPGLFHFARLAAESALCVGVNVLRTLQQFESAAVLLCAWS